MKMKKLVAGLLSAAMVFTSVSYNGYGVNQAEAAGAAVAKTEKVETLVKYAGTELASKAKANSETNANGQDGPASWAFDNSNHWWHSNYSNGAVQVPKYDITTDAKSAEGNNKGDIWIQTGFNSAQTVYGLEYTSRGGTENNQIREYEVWVSSAETEPAVGTIATGNNDGWTKAATGTFYQVARERAQVARFAQPATNVKWIRLVAKNVYGTNGYAAAKKIEFFTGVTESQANLNNYQSFWDAETNAGTLSVQTDKDRWQFEVKTGGKWKNYLTSGNKRTDGVFFEGGWRTDSNDSISRDGFRQRIGGAFEANALTWVAPEEGYYQFKQVGTASTSRVAGKMNLYFVTSNDGTGNGTDLDGEQNHNSGAPFESPVKEMQKGDKFRFASEKSTNNQDVNNYCDGNPKVNWEVIDCTKELATEKANTAQAEITNSKKPALALEPYQAAVTELTNLVATENPTTAALMAGIKKVENAKKTFDAYVPVTSVTFVGEEATHNLTVGASEVLNATVAPSNATTPAVTYKLAANADPSVVKITDNSVEAVEAGTTTVEVVSVENPSLKATCTINVTADLKKLDDAITAAKAVQNGADYQNKYTQASRDKYAAAIATAEAVRDKAAANHTKQAVVNKAAQTLTDAQRALVEIVKYNVTVQILDKTTTTKETDGTNITVTAEKAPEGQKFSHWTFDGKPVCYNTTYTFTVHGNANVKAVYVAKEASIEKKVSVICQATYENGKVKLTSKHSVPTDAGYTVVKFGVVATDSVGYKAITDANETLDHNIKSTKRWMDYNHSANSYLANYTYYIRTTRATTWYARGYVTYKDAQGKEYTVYSDNVVNCVVK